MADSNGITISGVITNSDLWVQGETMSLSFAFKNGSGVTIPKLVLEAKLMLKDFTDGSEHTSILLHRIAGTSAISGESVNLANGKSKTFTAAFAIPDTVTQYFSTYSGVRAVPIYIGYTAYDTSEGNFTSSFRLDNAKVLNRRYNPSVSNFSLERAKSNGAKDDEGEYVLADMKLALANKTNYANFMTAKVYYARNIDATTSNSSIPLTSSIPALLSGVTDSKTLIPNTFSNGSDWDFMLEFGDAYESTIARASLPRSFANVHLSGASTGGVSFGGFGTSTEGNPKTESHYPIYPYGGIKAVPGGAYESTLAFDSAAPFVVRSDNPLYPTLRVFGNVAELHAEIQPSKTIAGSTDYWPICTIPAAYLPDHEVVAVQQGSSQAVWMLRIFPLNTDVKDGNGVSCAGKACFSRYRNSMSEYTNATTSTWLPVHATWVVQGSASGGEIANAAMLADSTGALMDDAGGYAMTVASTTGNTVQLAHTAAQVDEAIDRTTILHNLYASGELQAEIANKVMEELPRYAGEVEDA